VELVWNGKSNEVCNVVLPFQVIEQVDEPRAEKPEDTALQGGLFDARGRQLQGWTNKLIWGDNKLILSSLKNGPLREEIEAQGGLKLIYIDPPFDVGADFSMDIEIGEETFTKKPSIIEEIAYRDTWGKGADSFISMIFERLNLMRDMLREDGSIYVHCDYRLSSPMRIVLDEVFGTSNFRNEIIWRRKTGTASSNRNFGVQTDTILYYSRSDDFDFDPQYRSEGIPQEEIEKKFNLKDENGRRYWSGDLGNPADRPNLKYVYKGFLTTKEWLGDQLKSDGTVGRHREAHFPEKAGWANQTKNLS
jgi:adenine-specific DNA-methyltransferase